MEFNPRAALGLTCHHCTGDDWETRPDQPIPFWPVDDQPPF
jgi:hypothetical protein